MKYTVIGLVVAILAGCGGQKMTKTVEVCQQGKCTLYNAEVWYTQDCSGTSGLPAQCDMVENIRVDLL